MKKKLLFVLLFVFILTLFGCNKSPQNGTWKTNDSDGLIEFSIKDNKFNSFTFITPSNIKPTKSKFVETHPIKDDNTFDIEFHLYKSEHLIILKGKFKSSKEAIGTYEIKTDSNSISGEWTATFSTEN